MSELNTPVSVKSVMRSAGEREDEHGIYQVLMFRAVDPAGGTSRIQEYTEDMGVHGYMDRVVVPGHRSGTTQAIDHVPYVQMEFPDGREEQFLIRAYTRSKRTEPESLPVAHVTNEVTPASVSVAAPVVTVAAPNVTVEAPNVTVEPNIQVAPANVVLPELAVTVAPSTATIDTGLPDVLKSLEGKFDVYFAAANASKKKLRFRALSAAEVAKLETLLYGTMEPGARKKELVNMMYEICCSVDLEAFEKAGNSGTMVSAAQAVAEFQSVVNRLRDSDPALTKELIFTILRFDFHDFAELHAVHLRELLHGSEGHVIAQYESANAGVTTSRSNFGEGVTLFQKVMRDVFSEGKAGLETPFLYDYAAQVLHIENTEYTKRKASSPTILKLISSVGTRCRDRVREAVKNPGVMMPGEVKIFVKALWYDPTSDRHAKFKSELGRLGNQEYSVMAVKADLELETVRPPKVDAGKSDGTSVGQTLLYHHGRGALNGLPVLSAEIPKSVCEQMPGKKESTRVCSGFAQVGFCNVASCKFQHVLPSKKAIKAFSTKWMMSASAKKSLNARLAGVAQKFPDHKAARLLPFGVLAGRS